MLPFKGEVFFNNDFFFLAVLWSFWDFSSQTRDWTQVAVKVPSPNHCTTREFPKTEFFTQHNALENIQVVTKVWFIFIAE